MLTIFLRAVFRHCYRAFYFTLFLNFYSHLWSFSAFIFYCLFMLRTLFAFLPFLFYYLLFSVLVFFASFTIDQQKEAPPSPPRIFPHVTCVFWFSSSLFGNVWLWLLLSLFIAIEQLLQLLLFIIVVIAVVAFVIIVVLLTVIIFIPSISVVVWWLCHFLFSALSMFCRFLCYFYHLYFVLLLFYLFYFIYFPCKIFFYCFAISSNSLSVLIRSYVS